MFINNDIKYIGVNDRQIDLFEGQYPVPEGISYNSYVIVDKKIAIMDSVDANFTDVWLENIKSTLKQASPDYLIIQHMEPDHSASAYEFLKEYPKTTIVASTQAFKMLENFFDGEITNERIVVKDGDILELGKHTLRFLTAPMVHWPEVIMTYDQTDRILFSADAFGKFGDLDSNEQWIDEARRYYFGIVGKYGMQVQTVLKKLSDTQIDYICPLHGPTLSQNLGYYLDLYDKWSKYQPENNGVMVAYTSIYGNTEKAVNLLVDALKENGCETVTVTDLARCDISKAVSDAFIYGKLVLATTTYNGHIFPAMNTFIHALLERQYQNRTIAIVENGSWAPVAAKVIKKMFESSKNITFTDTVVTINSSVKSNNLKQIEDVAKEVLK